MTDQKSGKQSEETRINKIKNFFGIGSSRGGSINVKNLEQPVREFIFTHELLKEISATSPANQRLRTIRELCDVVLSKRLEENGVEVLWLTLQDLLTPNTPQDDRQLVLHFLACLIRGQYDQLGLMRAQFFRLIKTHTIHEDLHARLDMFAVLTQEGKDLLYFEEETGAFLLEWMSEVMKTASITNFLCLLINIIKFNAAYLDEEVIAGLVSNTCHVASITTKEENIELCLRVLDTVLCYSYLPTGALYLVVTCLCKVVGVDNFCQEAWVLMRKLLGTHRGHSGVYTMCCILQDPAWCTQQGAVVLRGAVFFLGMALWGSKRVTSLKHSPSAVLPSFLQALVQSRLSIVAYEVVLSVQRLVNKYGHQQQDVAWQLILDLVEALLRHIQEAECPEPALISNVHDLLTSIETLHQQDQFNGSTERFFSIIETCAHKRPESSILVLVTHKSESIQPPRDNWLANLSHLLDKYFKQEVRTLVRIKVLDTLCHVITTNRNLYQDEILEVIVLPYLSTIDQDTDCDVRSRAVQLLIDVSLSCRSAKFIDLMDILKKVLHRPVCTKSDSSDKTTSALDDVRLAAEGLISVMKVKLYIQPSLHALTAFDLLVSHVSSHYQHMTLLYNAGAIRSQILELFLALRADCMNRVGLPDDSKPGQVTYSPYLLCSHREPPVEGSGLSPAHSPCTVQHNTQLLPYAQAFRCISTCLDEESDWLVLKVVLEKLPSLLQNRSLVLAAQPNHFLCLTTRICAMLSDKNLPEKLTNRPASFTKSHFHGYVFPVLTCLVSYHALINKNKQRDLIKCLEFGLVSRCARVCVRALSVCCLEMTEVMMRQLPAVLLKLSQISANTTMAIPLMESLSSLIHLPQLYSNFVEDQYMSIFAVALPYTNPFRYSHYIVSLAYHVIALWFLKCRLPFRKAFVPFIVKGLRANVLQQFEESGSQLSVLNQDSTDRSRTQSLNEESMRRRHHSMAANVRSRLQHTAGSSAAVMSAMQPDEALTTFHRELTDTCVDMLTRYTFSTYSSMPRRSPLAEFILKGGQSQSWLLSNNIITITTSGGAKVGPAGLCDKCVTLARSASKMAEQLDIPGSNPRPDSPTSTGSGRRRHKSAAVRPLSETVPMKTVSQDDMPLYRSLTRDTDSLEGGNLEEGRCTSLDSMVGSREQLHDETVGQEGGKKRERRESGLETRTDKVQAFDNLLMGLQGKQGSEMSIFSKHLCNCWCTMWAEIHLRRPTGNLSWMMRIQNDQDVAELFPDFSLSDISNLFGSTPHGGGGAEKEEESQQMIDSLDLGESKYESLLQEHFQVDTGKSAEKVNEAKLNRDNQEQHSRPSSMDESSLAIGQLESIGADKSPLKQEPGADAVTPAQTGTSGTTQQEGVASGKENEQGNLSRRGSEVRLSAGGSGVTTGGSGLTTGGSGLTTGGSGLITGGSGLTTGGSGLTTGGSGLTTGGSGMTGGGSGLSGSGSGGVYGEGTLFQTGDNKRLGLVAGSKGGKEGMQGGINPSFLFLQLYNAHLFGPPDERPCPLLASDVVTRSLKLLDLIYPYDTHKIGILYVSPGQENNETAILSNMFGSPRYMSFLDSLGSLVRLEDCSSDRTYLGGLNTDGSDGKFSYIWHEEFIQVIFHVATLMPNKDSDPNRNAKKLHLGNDYVTIVYNDGIKEHKIGTIKGQFDYVNVVINPLDHGMNAVTVQTKKAGGKTYVAMFCVAEIEDIIGHTDTKIISDANLGVLVRQMAIHANLASTIMQKQQTNPKDPYASNWLERLRHIKRLKSKVLQENAKVAAERQGHHPPHTAEATVAEDFTDCV